MPTAAHACPQVHRLLTLLQLVPWDSFGRTMGYARDPLLGLNYYFATSGEEASITFRRNLSHATIHTLGGVLVGAGCPTVSLGPDVEMNTEWIEFDTREVRLEPGSGLMLRSGLLDYGTGESPKVRLLGEGAVDIWWPQIRYPWLAFAASRDDPRQQQRYRVEIKISLESMLARLRPVDWLSESDDRGDELFLYPFELGFGSLFDHSALIEAQVKRAFFELGLFTYRRGFLSASIRRFWQGGFNLSLLVNPPNPKHKNENEAQRAYQGELGRLYRTIIDQVKRAD